MMKAKEIRFTGANGVSLPGIIWYPMCSPTMVVQITHGMTEHIGRYEELAYMLTAYGIAVAGFDLRGHGRNPGDNQCASFGENGWNYALHDMHLFYLELESKFPNIPHFMMSVCSCVKRQRKTQTFFSVCSKCKISGTTSYCFSADNSEKHPLQISLPLKGVTLRVVLSRVFTHFLPATDRNTKDG